MTDRSEAISSGPIVLFDGTCGFCDGAVRWFIARDTDARLRFAPLQSPTGQRLLAANRLPANFDKSLVLVDETGRAFTYSTGTFRILRSLRGFWGVTGSLGLLVPRFLRDAAYRLVAARRHRISAMMGQNCTLPSPAERARYIDHAAA
jgi:predicted DCC family thiol-disulfide oxidoreductase YuxK